MIQTYTYTQKQSISKHNILIAVEMQLSTDLLEAV